LDYRGISIDYAYQPFGDLTTTNRVSLNYSFGGPSFRPQASAQAGQAGPRPMATPAPQRTPEAAQQALPTDPMARAQALEQLGRNTEALEAFNAAVKANPANEAAWRGMGELYTRLGQKAYAVQCYEQVLRLRPADSQFRAWLDRFKAP
jgi:tetratricopeptide (TPR) repeat protein